MIIKAIKFETNTKCASFINQRRSLDICIYTCNDNILIYMHICNSNSDSDRYMLTCLLLVYLLVCLLCLTRY